MMTCGKCNGKGHLKTYTHIAGGVCFECNGSGRVNGDGSASEKLYQLYVGHSESAMDCYGKYFTLEEAIADAPRAMICENPEYADYTHAEVCKKLKTKGRIKFMWDNFS